ncbi:hypothetical protein Adt_31042 [Abeliophyllum distichum]|uniref:Uncharacterized protein n=1 Tax=Abeliophyllum distichum TaxID=126358 RepID=A0ABD1RDU3_9LAMI
MFPNIVNLQVKNTKTPSREACLLGRVMRPDGETTRGDQDNSSFDLGIGSQSNNECLILDEALVLTEADIKMIDDTVELKVGMSIIRQISISFYDVYFSVLC